MHQSPRRRGDINMTPKIIMFVIGAVVLTYLFINIALTDSSATKQCDISQYPFYAEEINGSNCKEIKNANFGKFQRLRRVDLGNSNLKEIPKGLPSTVEILLLGNNPITLISNIEALPHLRILALRGCKVSSVDGAALPESLMSLVLTENSVEVVKNMKQTNLIKLMLSHNKLRSINDLPESLELLRLSNNADLEINYRMFGSLPRLRWIACSAIKTARLTPTGAAKIKLESVQLSDLTDRRKIGSGASGVVYSSTWMGRAVAIKQFKKSSSDGKSSDELEVISHINHIDIVSPVAVLKGDSGLLVNLIHNAESLGSPPDFDTIVRNRKKVTITAPLLINTLKSISSAMAYLHKSGIAHGDLYAHNILFSKDSFIVRLSDFGASWFVPQRWQTDVETIEVRAFGVLVEDLLTWMDPIDMDTPAARSAAEMAERCQLENPPPRFSELEDWGRKLFRQRALDKIEGYKKSAAESL